MQIQKTNYNLTTSTSFGQFRKPLSQLELAFRTHVPQTETTSGATTITADKGTDVFLAQCKKPKEKPAKKPKKKGRRRVPKWFSRR